MNCNLPACSDCPARIVCRCLQVTEAAMVQAITALDLQTLMDVRRQTGAGEGCTCCHEQIRQFLEQLHCAPAKCA